TTRALPTGTYVVSYWTKGTNALTFNNSYTYSGLINLPVNVKGWSYHQMTVVLPGAVSFVFSPASGGVATLVDDICIYPVGAQMTTYTYAPQVGMTSMTDSKGLATTYEYDSNQRLINVKDKDGNITKHYDYHYQNQ
ncbi:MAG: hypothetical protein JWQ57_4159, partial [Mucilaginibacter sp.]|nr:hypothetical protein [Mucilaginibacter sp.]